MNRISVGRKLYFSVLAIFLIFAVSFIIFQQSREKEFKIISLNMKLQEYNERMEETLQYIGGISEVTLSEYVKKHHIKDLRVTIIDKNGNVIFDNIRKDYNNIKNHANRREIIDALKSGSGEDISRLSETVQKDFFYSATYFPKRGIIIRSALPYNDDLSKSLQTDLHYIWFAVIAMIILTVVLYRFTSRLGANITKLRVFASRADNNEPLDTEDLINFPNDELGEIAERIIKIYMRLESTRQEQDILKRQLTQNIAHELKTPVASIQGYLETIIENPRIDTENREQFLLRCYEQSKRLTSLLQDISTLNRMDDAPDLVVFEDVDITETVANIERETALQLQEKKMNFINKLPAQLCIKGNQSLIYSIFRNLTDNAIAHAGEHTTITLSAEKEDQQWHFIFSDNGAGVASEHLSRLFERFYRIDKGRSRKLGGTGLGLAIVKNAVLIHGGSITASNNPEGGLRFDFYLKN